MNYQTFEPHQDLTPLIKCYWTLESPKEISPGKQTIIPDGCLTMSQFYYTRLQVHHYLASSYYIYDYGQLYETQADLFATQHLLEPHEYNL